MVWLKDIWAFICRPYKIYKENKAIKKKMAELKKRDPFIYK
tara:strand:+ start:422 stop:544 length:123 start_codon:yes stop_codon:yes gene_type:complete